MALRDLLYGVYERRLEQSLSPEQVPRHIGVILDGMRPEGASPLSPPAPSREQLERAHESLGASRGD